MNRLLSTFVVGLAGIQGITLAGEVRPRLVVGIVVDQLRTDYLEDLRDMFSSGGFRRLMDNGLYLRDVDFVVSPGDAASASAIIQTGAYPRQNGIPGSMVYQPSAKTLKPVFLDPAYIGNFTTETYSPSALKVTTLTDEISLDGQGKSRIHSIAPDAAQAIVLAGHEAKSSFWVNDETGKWSSSTYYPYPPAYLQNINYNSPLVSRLDTIRWMPLRKDEPYPYVNSIDIKEGFRYTFPRSDRDVFTLYKNSPFVNRDITDAATDYVRSQGLGLNPETTDVLNLGYTLSPYPAITDEDYRYELQDSYLRLDKDLERLFNTLDRQVGRDNVVVYLVSTGYFNQRPFAEGESRMPGGTFSVKRALSLLNSYFAAKYGNGSYVDGFSDNQIFFDKKEIEAKNLDINAVAQEARDFLIKMSGVADAYTLTDLISPSIPELEAHRLALDPKTAGELIVEFNPGWNVVDDSKFPPETIVNKTTAYLFPGFIMGPGIEQKTVDETVEAVTIAPTLANALHIRSPNSTMSKPLKVK